MGLRHVLLTCVWLVLGAPCLAQPTAVVATSDTLQWDMAANPAIEAQSLRYVLSIDPSAPTATTLRLSAVTCVDVGTGSRCSAPLPAMPLGTHRLTLRAVAASVSSTPLDVSVAITYPACVFPTGASALSVFPVRLLSAGNRSAIQFQLGSSVPVTNLAVLLQRGTEAPIAVARMDGDHLTGVGALWFDHPKVSGDYRVSIHAANQAGCSVVQGTIYTIAVQ
jgi:hypothetical protein